MERRGGHGRLVIASDDALVKDWCVGSCVLPCPAKRRRCGWGGGELRQRRKQASIVKRRMQSNGKSTIDGVN